MRQKRFWQSLAPVLTFVAALAGCDKMPSLDEARDAVSGSVDDLKQAAENTGEDIKQAAGAAGSVEFQLNGAVQISGCYASLYAFSDGRASVLQITSYNSPTGESYPSIILRAEVTGKSYAELRDQKIAAQAFVQKDRQEAVWQAIEDPLELIITAADATTLAASFTGTLENVQTGERQQVSGQLMAVPRLPNSGT